MKTNQKFWRSKTKIFLLFIIIGGECEVNYCKECRKGDPARCKKCHKKYNLRIRDHKCVKCDEELQLFHQGDCQACRQVIGEGCQKCKPNNCSECYPTFKAVFSTNGKLSCHCHETEATIGSFPPYCHLCSKIDRLCIRCSSIHTCSSCTPGYLPVTKNRRHYCEKICKDNPYMITTRNNICFDCRDIQHCVKCDPDLKCTECKKGYEYVEYKGKMRCQVICKDHQGIILEENVCYECLIINSSRKRKNRCIRCQNIADRDSFRVCQQCKPEFRLQSAESRTKNDNPVQCIVKCPENTCYRGNDFELANEGLDLIKTCLECNQIDPNCSSCYKDDQYCAKSPDGHPKCLKCFNGYVVQNTNNGNFDFCKKECGENQGYIKAGNRCYDCSGLHPKCKECSENTFMCTKCQDGYTVAGNEEGKTWCRKVCPPEKEARLYQETCERCNLFEGASLCSTCSYQQDTETQSGLKFQCDSCIDPENGGDVKYQVFDKPPLCRRICKKQEVFLLPDMCMRCDSSDKNCIECEASPDFRNRICTQCKEGHSVVKNFCRVDCKDDEGWEPYNKCTKCSSKVKGCVRCTDEIINCKRCERGYLLLIKDNFCKKICDPSSEAYDSRTNTCVKCSDYHRGGQTCQDEFPFKLVSCDNEHFLNHKGRCQRKCNKPRTAFIPPNNCTECYSKHCLSCQNSTVFCIECVGDYVIDSSNRTRCELPTLGLVNVKSKYFSKIESSIIILFDKPIKKKEYQSILEIEYDEDMGVNRRALQLDENKTEKPVHKSIITMVEKNTGIKIKFDFQGSKYKGKITIKKVGNKTIEALNEKYFYLTEDLITVEKIDFFMDQAFEQLAENKQTATQAGMGISFMFILMNPGMAVIFLKIIQTYEIYRFINAELPSNAQMILSFSEPNILDIFPNYLYYEETEETVGCLLAQEIIRNGKDCLLMNNGVIPFILQLIFFGMLKLIFRGLIHCSQEDKDTFVYKFSKKASGKLNIGFAIGAVSAVQMDLFIGVMINLRNFFIYPFILFVNSVASLVIMLMYIFFAYKVIRKTWDLAKFESKLNEKQNNNQKQSEIESVQKVSLPKNLKKWKVINENLKENVKSLGRYYNCFVFIKEFIIAAVILGFLKSAVIQIPLCISYNLFLIYVAIKYRPLQSSFEMVTYSLGVFIEIVLLILFALVMAFGSKEEQYKYRYFGNGIVVVIIIAFVFYIVVGTVEIILFIGESLALLCKKMSKKKKALKNKANKSQVASKRGEASTLEESQEEIMNRSEVQIPAKQEIIHQDKLGEDKAHKQSQFSRQKDQRKKKKGILDKDKRLRKSNVNRQKGVRKLGDQLQSSNLSASKQRGKVLFKSKTNEKRNKTKISVPKFLIQSQPQGPPSEMKDQSDIQEGDLDDHLKPEDVDPIDLRLKKRGKKKKKRSRIQFNPLVNNIKSLFNRQNERKKRSRAKGIQS